MWPWGLPDRGVLLLFPEGGNFAAGRGRLAIGELRRKGRRSEAQEPEKMTQVLPPRSTGVVAALRGNPNADVIFAAHTGLGLAAFPRELWRAAPIGRTLRTRMWLWPADDLPDGPEEQSAWVHNYWKQIDEWVEEQGKEPESVGVRGH